MHFQASHPQANHRAGQAACRLRRASSAAASFPLAGNGGIARALRRAALLVLLAIVLPACSPTGALVGAGAGVGVTAAEERGFRGAISDATIRGEINYLWLDYDPKVQLRLGLSIYEGRVLVTGPVDNEEQRARVIELAWQPQGVREVINEVIIDKEGERGAGNYLRDVWISTQLRSNLLFDKDVSSLNYSVETVRGTVYVMGIAQDRKELDRVLDHARNIEYVRGVVNHAILVDDPRRPARALERLKERREKEGQSSGDPQ